MEIKRILAVGVILLFIGVTVAPTINFNTVKASQDDDLVEVTTQACGIQGYGNTTVKLTREQYQDLEQYLVEFRARLYQTSTREEAVPIFKEAVVELDKYGLLPRGMSVEQALILITRSCQDEKKINWTEKLSKKIFSIFDNTSNVLCLIAGFATETRFLSLSSRASFIFSLILLVLAERIDSAGILKHGLAFKVFAFPFLSYYILSNIFGNIFPISILQWIRFGAWVSRPGYRSLAEGWIYTLGMQGKKTWNQTFYGAITQDDYLNVGAMGFTGIKLCIPYLDFYAVPYISLFIGSALLVKIRPEPR